MIALFTEYRDVFAWSHEDMKGLDPKFYQHKINLASDAKPVQQWQYRMNPNYAARVKEEIDKLLKAGFIQPVKQATWLSPIVVVPKKNGKFRVCVDYWKLNTSGVFLSHNVSKERIAVDPNKISTIIQAKTSANAKALAGSWAKYVGTLGWYAI